MPTCNVAAAPLSFGTGIPNPVNSNVDATTSITATCSNGAPYTIGLSLGGGAGGSFAARRMTSGASNFLIYVLYTDAAHATVWGDGSGGSEVFRGTGNGTAQSIAVHGRIPSGQTAAPGAYRDTIFVVITF